MPPNKPHHSSTDGSGKLKPISTQGAKEKAAREAAREAARAHALRIKQLQENALKNLPRKKLYIVLYLRSDPPIHSDFHWGFYYHKESTGGTKYHVKNIGSGWVPDHGPTGGVFKSNFLCVVIEIATIPPNKEQLLDQLMKTYDHNLNDTQGITCRVWVMKILALLVQHGLAACSDLPGLQAECFNFGNQHMATAVSNDQPRPVVVSIKCS
jgi:hypothetical protein